MKLIATKNQNKKEDKHPDFRIYVKNEEGNVIEEEYKKSDGTTGIGWKPFGAMWHNVENGKIKSSMIDLDLDAINALNGTNTNQDINRPAEGNFEPHTDAEIEDPSSVPF